jgi:arylformamidase
MMRDITRSLRLSTAVFPGDTPVSFTQVMRMRDGDACNVSSITMSVHAGTHIDAPRHYSDEAPGAESLDLDVLVGPAQVVTVGTSGPLSLVDVQALDLIGAPRLILHTRASDTPDDVFDPSFTCFTPEAADWLGKQGVRLVGTDAPSVDEVTREDLPAHKTFLRHGIVIIENLCLRGVPDGEYQLVALPLKIVDGDAAPARVILI